MCSQEKSLPGSFLWCLISVARVAAYFYKEIKFEKDTKFCWPGLYSGVSCCGQAGQGRHCCCCCCHMTPASEPLGVTETGANNTFSINRQQPLTRTRGGGFELQKVDFMFLNRGIFADWLRNAVCFKHNSWCKLGAHHSIWKYLCVTGHFWAWAEESRLTCGKIENLRVEMIIGILLQEFGLYF